MRLKGTCGDIFFLLVDLLGFGASTASVAENPPPKAVFFGPRPRLISGDTKRENRRENVLFPGSKIGGLLRQPPNEINNQYL